ncbi:MAG: PDZ domain-containing protein [Candidatus Hydrogenedentota bacterium]
MYRLAPLALFVCALIAPAFAQGTRLLQQPAIHGDTIAFVYAGDIWLATTSGGDARRLTTSVGVEESPAFSPDGASIAFTGQYDGNTDVFVVPASGGDPERLTFHPSEDTVRGWTPDGKRVLFESGRDNPPANVGQLWTISASGGMPERLPFHMAFDGAYSSDGARIAYVPVSPAFTAWRHYRGGRTTSIRVVTMSDLAYKEVPRENSNDYHPFWVGGTLYFVSDRAGTMNLFTYEGANVRQLTRHDDFDVQWADGDAGRIVYEQAGYLHLYDVSSGQSRQLEITVTGDFPWERPHYEKVGDEVRSFAVSPSGARAVFEARGDIFTLPAEKGDARQLTTTSNANDRSPAWSPDGESIAWFSDQSGEYALYIAAQSGDGDPKIIEYDDASFYYSPQWSPDSKQILFTDKHLAIWIVDAKSGKATRVDADNYDHPERSTNPAWAPDSKWVAYAKRLDNQLRAIFVYSLDKGESYQITDGLSDAISPAFDRTGKYLYFLASTNYALSIGWLDMTSYVADVTRVPYLVVLDKDEPSPLLPESDEEKPGDDADKDEKKDDDKNDGDEKGDKRKEEVVDVTIDLDGIAQRILAIDVPARAYPFLTAGPEKSFFYAESIPNKDRPTLHKYDLEKRKSEEFIADVNGVEVSADGKKLLYQSDKTFGIVATDKPAKSGDGKLATDKLESQIDPSAEWRQIYAEVYRVYRDFFYDEHIHGADWPAMRAKYGPMLEHVRHRADLTHVLNMFLAEAVAGHTFVGGGDQPKPGDVAVGLLGADYERDDDHFRFARIYDGESWNPELRAPLRGPGVEVKLGDYLLEVNGASVTGPNVYAYFQATAGKQTTLKIADNPRGRGERAVTVVPVESETGLRRQAWMEDNRRTVDKLSNGRLAYVYLPNTSTQGYTNFNRYYFGQQDRSGAIIDERFNGGGSVADFMIDLMDRPLLSYWATRNGRPFPTPNAAIFGPKVMIINEYAGSGGDFLPWAFRERGIGKLVGKRTWGGLIGVFDYPVLIDGGFVTAPRLAIYSKDGEWIVENVGVSPDIEVEFTPADFAAHRDPQLERAIQIALDDLEKNPVHKTPRPAPIDRTSK